MPKNREELIASYPQSLIESIKKGGTIELRIEDQEKSISVGGSPPEGIAKELGDDGAYHQDQSLVEAAANSLEKAVERGELRCHPSQSARTGAVVLSYRLP
jgi:hypothetical protein